MSHPSQLTLSLDNNKFCAYHEAHPQIYEEFKKLTVATIERGFKHYSAKGIFELIRWHTGVKSKEDCFDVNNNYTPYYARLFEKDHPEHKGFFRKRESKFDL
jgi:hypothetical protein